MSPLQTIRLAAFEERHYRLRLRALGLLLDAAHDPAIVRFLQQQHRHADARLAELEGVGA